MLISYFNLISISLCIFGYSYGVKKLILFFLKNEEQSIKINNLDIFFGLFMINFLVLLAHFFIPIKNISILLFLVGFIFFIKSLFIKNLYKINFLSYSAILFLILFINSSNNLIYDTQLYHQQIINWNFNYKIIFNLAIADERLGMISPWQLLLSIGNYSFFGVKSSFLINFIPISILLNETYKNIISKKEKFSSLFIILASFYIIFYSLIHPFGNGIIMMHLGSLGTDLPAMILFILSIYVFIKCVENYNQKNLDYELLLILSFFTIFCRISYLPIIILPIFLLFRKKIFLKKININIFFSLPLILWSLRSLINNGCLIFPIKYSCFELKDYISIKEVENFSNIIKSFARTAPEYQKFMDLNFSIYSNSWFKPWIINYFFQQSLTQIFIFFTFILIVPCSYYFFKSNLKYKYEIFVISLLFFFIIILWLQAPDIRFGLGFLVSLPCLFFTIIINNNIRLIPKNSYLVSFAFLLGFLSIKNIDNYEFLFNKELFDKKQSYNNYKVLYKFDKFKVVNSNDPNKFCHDIKEICISKNDINFDINNIKYDYIFFRAN